MSKTAIDVQGLDKIYRLGVQEERSDTFSGAIMNTLKAPFKNFRKLKNLSSFKNKEEEDVFHALQDVSFKINVGEVVGIIGRNGAGKSTLLKILSRITEPTGGSAKVYGRVASLLEVGTGFNVELTGRENIYLNGTILGMTKSEIDRKFDEIIEFSGVAKFLDTPVKRYSSGMRVRLAFSVAAHLEPEILLVDEVLAVGDMEFQRKCLGKMNEVATQGRTVLFVSHNMGAVQELCTRGIVLKKGQTVFDGNVNEAITYYLDDSKSNPSYISKRNFPISLGQILINGKIDPSIASDEAMSVAIPITAKNVENPQIIFIVEDFLSQNIVHQSVYAKDLGYEYLDGEILMELRFPALHLTPGIYAAYFKFKVSDTQVSNGKLDSEKFFFEVDVPDSIRVSGFSHGKKGTILAPPMTWAFEEATKEAV